MSEGITTHYTFYQMRQYLKNPSGYSNSEKWSGITIHKEKNAIYKDGKIIVPYEYIVNFLEKLYNDPKTGLRGIDKLFKYIQERYVGISRADVEKFVKNNETNQLHLPRVKAVVNKPIISRSIGNRIHCDLIDMSKYAGLNNGVNWLLTVIDAFSKFVWVVPLKNKEAITVADAMSDIIATMDKVPNVCQTDNGSEFVSAEWKYLMGRYEIIHVRAKPYHARANGAIERFNRTIKTLIARYMTHYNTQHYIGVLADLVLNYNNSSHSTTNHTPDYAYYRSSKQEQKQILEKQINRATKWVSEANQLKLPTIHKGDVVRLSAEVNKEVRKNTLNRKGYDRHWSDELYRISRISQSKSSAYPDIYHIEDISGLPIRGEFYRDQLMLVDESKLISRPRPIDAPRNKEVFNREYLLKHDLPNRQVIPADNANLPPTALEERKLPEAPKRIRKPNKKYLD
mgnify:CR=1 FL=1